MTPSMEDYAALATEIGLQLDISYGRKIWHDRHNATRGGIDLPAYLAEPAQMSRILRANLPGEAWDMDNVRDVWIARRLGIGLFAGAAAPEEAVRDCAALALRERA